MSSDNIALPQLESAVTEYKAARMGFEIARIEYELAKERYIRTKDLAFGMMSTTERGAWIHSHRELALINESIGDAIQDIMINDCLRLCQAFLAGDSKVYKPKYLVDGIVGALKRGGFEFRSATPGREVNAALMRLKGIKRDGLFYSPSDEQADDCLRAVKEDFFV